jgi:hypothetical protein
MVIAIVFSGPVVLALPNKGRIFLPTLLVRDALASGA